MSGRGRGPVTRDKERTGDPMNTGTNRPGLD